MSEILKLWNNLTRAALVD